MNPGTGRGEAVIVGKALYAGSFTLEESLAATGKKGASGRFDQGG